MKGGLENLAGNEANSKTQFFSSVNVNNATLINTAKKNAEQICAIDQDTTDVICKAGNQMYNIENLAGKTLVVNGGDLTLQGQMNSSNEPLDIFINGGNLILDLNTTDPTSFTEDGLWYRSVKPGDEISKGQVLGHTEDCFGNVLREYRAEEDGIVLYGNGGLKAAKGHLAVAYGRNAYREVLL
jgi:hypothetical protein